MGPATFSFINKYKMSSISYYHSCSLLHCPRWDNNLFTCLSKKFIFLWYVNMSFVHLCLFFNILAMSYSLKHTFGVHVCGGVCMCVWSSYLFSHSLSVWAHLLNLLNVGRALEIDKVEVKPLLCYLRAVLS